MQIQLEAAGEVERTLNGKSSTIRTHIGQFQEQIETLSDERNQTGSRKKLIRSQVGAQEKEKSQLAAAISEWDRDLESACDFEKKLKGDLETLNTISRAEGSF
jgi:chromosome segregation ATPase